MPIGNFVIQQGNDSFRLRAYGLGFRVATKQHTKDKATTRCQISCMHPTPFHRPNIYIYSQQVLTLDVTSGCKFKQRPDFTVTLTA